MRLASHLRKYEDPLTKLHGFLQELVQHHLVDPVLEPETMSENSIGP